MNLLGKNGETIKTLKAYTDGLWFIDSHFQSGLDGFDLAISVLDEKSYFHEPVAKKTSIRFADISFLFEKGKDCN